VHEHLRASGRWLAKYYTYLSAECFASKRNCREKLNICFTSNVFSPKSYDFNGLWTKESQFAKPSTLCLLTIPKSSSDTYSKPLLVSNKIEILRRLTCRVPSGCTSIKHTYLLLWDEREWDFSIFLTYIMLGWYSTIILRFALLISNCITLYNSKTTGFDNGTYVCVVCTYRRLIASVIKLQRRMCRLKGEEVRGPWVKQYNTKVNNFCSLPNIIKVMKSKATRWRRDEDCVQNFVRLQQRTPP